MSNLVTINKNFSIEDSFWHLNPQLVIMKPFSKLYNADKSKDKMESSKQMWCVFFCSSADEENNLFYRIPIEERKEMLKETYVPKINWNDSLFKECCDSYPLLCMNSTERALQEMKEFLMKRKKALLAMDYNLESMKHIDAAIGANLKIYQDFEKIEALFMQEKKKTIVRGGRNLSLAEKGIL
jgi:hypothetical protein